MKQYTTPEQTAKLIELGFKKPRIDAGVTKWEGYEPICTGSYTLGELIEMLPISFEIENDITVWLEIESGISWSVLYSYCGFAEYDCERKELIDALFGMVLQLKEEGVI